MGKVNLDKYFAAAVNLHKSGKLSEARRMYQQVLNAKPDHIESLAMIGQSYYGEGQYELANQAFSKGLRLKPDDLNLSMRKARSLIKLANYGEAATILLKLTQSHEENAQVWFHYGRSLKATGKYEEAIQAYQKVLIIQPMHVEALNNLGNLYQSVFDFDSAIKCYDDLIAVEPVNVWPICNKASLLLKMGYAEEAERLFHKAIEMDEHCAIAHYNLGVIAGMRFDPDSALKWMGQAIMLNENDLKYQSNYAYQLWLKGEKEQAIKQLKELIARGVAQPDPFIKLAKIQLELKQYEKVVETLKKILVKDKYSHEACYMLASVLDFQNKFGESEYYATQVMMHPDYSLRATMLLQSIYSKSVRMDEYDKLMEQTADLLMDYSLSHKVEEDFPVYNLSYYPFEHDLTTAVRKKYSTQLTTQIARLRDSIGFKYPEKKEKLKIGYLCPVFNTHPSSHLIQDILLYHDREVFQVYAFGLNREKDEVTDQIKRQVDGYIDLSDLGYKEAAEKIAEEGIHILISLSGYNFGMKNQIPALKPAPIQVISMDYHESMQVDFYDYTLKDEFCLLPEMRSFYNESIAYLPGSHFFNSRLIPSEKEIKRSKYHLPEDHFVFGCLNHTRKYTPTVLDAWAAILKHTSNSVLWLYDLGLEEVRKNIIAQFKKRGVNDSRIFFCGKEPYRDHYKRMGLMDVFLDTPVYNGHTTALEALWMSVPVVTVLGETVSARLCGSYLNAAEMTEFICRDMEEYIQKAIRLVNDTQYFKKIRHDFKMARENSSLFDTLSLTKNIEKAYLKMWEIYEAGKLPHDFKIA